MSVRNNGKSNRRELAGKELMRVAVTSLGILLVACVALGFSGWVTPSPTSAQMAQSSADLQSVQYPSGGTMIDAYIARPAGAAAKSPAVILVHDDLGANSRFQQLTRQFAEAGFVTLTPNLLSRVGKSAMEPVNGPQVPFRRTPVVELTPYQSVEDVKAAFTFLQQDPGVDPDKISAVGVGWGEFRVWKLAEAEPTLHRAVVFYGVTPANDDDLKTIQASVLGNYAEQDYIITMRVLKTKKLLGDKFTYYIYDTTPGFLGGSTGQILSAESASGTQAHSLRGSPASARMAATKEALSRTIEFIR